MPATHAKTQKELKPSTIQRQMRRERAKTKILAQTQPDTGGIADRAMLVDLTVHRWDPAVTDHTVGSEVARANESDANMGRYRKDLFPKDALKKINSLSNEIRGAHWYRTLPWRDGGVRILSSTGYFEYQTAISKLMSELDQAVSEFVAGFDDHIKTAEKRLGKLFNRAEYPVNKQQLAAKYGVELRFMPIPMQEDFRVQLGDDETRRIKESIQAGVQATVDAAMKDVWSRLREVVQKAADKLKAYERTEEGTTGRFRDSLISNIVELLDIIPALNVIDDPALTEFAATIRQEITQHSPEVLRDDDQIRSAVAARADEILSKMSAFLG